MSVTTTPDSPPRDEPLRIAGRVLPEGLERELWIVDGTISPVRLPGARTLAEDCWVMPALVDAHLHPGVAEIGGPLDLPTLDADLRALAHSGIGAARVVGSPSPIPGNWHARAGLPLLRSAGVAVAAPGRFIDGWGRRADGPELPSACAEECTAHWGKIIADWFDDEGGYGPSYSPQQIASAVAAVHATGARVAVHTQGAEAGASAAAAGADSIEHGMHLPDSALHDLASNGGFLVPTGYVFTRLAESMSDPGLPERMRTWFADGVAGHPEVVASALAAGVTVLAGTDLPVGSLVDEVLWLHAAGMSAHQAVGAASWTAREVLDLPRLRPGDRADLLCLATDPGNDPEVLRTPDLVVLDGRPIRRYDTPREVF